MGVLPSALPAALGYTCCPVLPTSAVMFSGPCLGDKIHSLLVSRLWEVTVTHLLAAVWSLAQYNVL